VAVRLPERYSINRGAMADKLAQQSSSTDSVKLKDGTVMQIARLPEVDEKTWGGMKSYLEGNPEIAKGLQNFSKNPEAMRGWLQTQAIAEYYQTRLERNNQTVVEKIDQLENNSDFAHVFEEIKRSGITAAMKHWDDEELLTQISEHMGGIPQELQPILNKVEQTPLSLHEAAKRGEVKSVADHLKKKSMAVDAHNPKGITALGYAVGGNNTAVVKLLVESRADPHSVDANGNSGLHYAAGYGHKELVEYMLQLGVDVNQVNSQGQNARAVAVLNKHQACIDLLLTRGSS